MGTKNPKNKAQKPKKRQFGDDANNLYEFWGWALSIHFFLGLSSVLQYVQTAVDIYTPPTAPLGYPNKQYPSTTVRAYGL
eukprot:5777177-Amphidinium_carterae.1